MDRARASKIAQAWIDASPDEQAALNRFALLEDALTRLLPADDPPGPSRRLPTGRPSSCSPATRCSRSPSRAASARAPPRTEVRCHFARTSESTLGIDLVDGPEAVHSRWRFARPDADPLELSGDERTERFARTLARAAGWQASWD